MAQLTRGSTVDGKRILNTDDLPGGSGGSGLPVGGSINDYLKGPDTSASWSNLTTDVRAVTLGQQITPESGAFTASDTTLLAFKKMYQQLGNKQPEIDGAATSITNSNLTTNRVLISNASGKVAVNPNSISANRLVRTSSTANQLQELTAITANRALISDANGFPVHSAITNTELGYLTGITSSIQTQLNAKAPNNHAGTTATYGVSTRTDYGHLRVTSNDGLGVTSLGTSALELNRAISFNMVGNATTAGNAGLSIDLNDYRTPGEWYFYINPTGLTNAPAFSSASTGTYIKVIMGYSTTNCIQLCWARASSEMWIRHCTTATAWQPWQRFLTSSSQIISAVTTGTTTGLTLSSGVLGINSANGTTTAGIVSTSAQTLAGVKTFSSIPLISAGLSDTLNDTSIATTQWSKKNLIAKAYDLDSTGSGSNYRTQIFRDACQYNSYSSTPTNIVAIKVGNIGTMFRIIIRGSSYNPANVWSVELSHYNNSSYTKAIITGNAPFDSISWGANNYICLCNTSGTGTSWGVYTNIVVSNIYTYSGSLSQSGWSITSGNTTSTVGTLTAISLVQNTSTVNAVTQSNGLTLTSGTLALTLANGTSIAGSVSTTTQTFGGEKTFTTAPRITASLASTLNDTTVVTAAWVKANATIPVLTADPSNPSTGQIWIRSDLL